MIGKFFREHLFKNKAGSISDSAGIWSDRDLDVDEYIRNLRTEKRFEKI